MDYVFYSATATLPTKVTQDAAGFDLFASETVRINPRETRTIDTGLGIAIPEGYYGKIESKSSFALRGLAVLGGIIDSDYRGPMMIIMHNLSEHKVEILAGSKAAQLVIQPYVKDAYFHHRKSALPASERGNAKFGELD